ncbi:hypothetical protein PDJAM_G00024460 [Pangasius djambal]|uniref:Uncharacterized protein n=1 Tax=Pangasius djambal TaxID=1691987 RepID=A0ACC5YPU5_9TELE|nr:hypothetical protein [Pangasius djambal]
MIVGGAGCLFQNINPERETTDNYHHGHCHEHFNTENHHAMPETVFEPHAEEMETVFMEVEV